MISVVLPSYNSLSYLKIFYNSLKKNSKLPFELIVHDNGSTDGTLDWLISNKILFTHSDTNEGYCAVNRAINAARMPYTMIFNSDMYVLPGWDLAVLNQINQFKKNDIERFTISCCLIEPIPGNPEYDYFPGAGDCAENFNEQALLDWYTKTKPIRQNTKQWSHPLLVPTKQLLEVRGFDEQYFPGWNVDNDLPKTLYDKGCRNFCMLGNARVFHFVSKTFSKLPPEIRNKHGQDIFFKKWGLTTDEFRANMKIKQPFEMVK